ncbi:MULTISPECIES: hypothetical protein [unclassified Fusibacter]|uniref:hypothetical protein n=1 Tax=unclassified Fusibacter TaxID=2624464 RepID=UPI0013E90596|nr:MULTISPECIES: hypothetical protein [unclassified Fusibacter]MCK8060246.1 hypothetical protein [Fusibacter sp. A2]NPE20467.1 hypothetical protein [Fusibacter sp. A1]
MTLTYGMWVNGTSCFMIRSQLNVPVDTGVVYLAQKEVLVDPVDLTKYDEKYGMVVQ